MRYGAFDGKNELLEEISHWLKKTYNIDANPKDEIALVFGTKAGLSSLPSIIPVSYTHLFGLCKCPSAT